MDAVETREPLKPGDTAPDFALPAITEEAEVRLWALRGDSPVMLGFFRGVYCPFCRRNIALLDAAGRKLAEKGITTAAVVTSPVERAKLYFRLRRPAMTLLADPAMETHRAYRLPRFEITQGPTEWPHRLNEADLATVKINPFEELSKPVPLAVAGRLLDKKDGFIYAAGDQDEANVTWNQLGGLFLIGSDGVVRWSFVENEIGPDSTTGFVSEADIVAASERLSG